MKNAELARLLVDLSYRVAMPGEEFQLASGDKSAFYWECQMTTLSAKAFPLMGRAFLDKFRALGVRPEAVGGLVLGSDPIALAIANTSDGGPDIHAFRIRKEPKSHGTQRWVEACPKPGSKVVVVDDVVTRGGSVCKAIRACREEGLDVIACVVLLDREQGGMQMISEEMDGAPCAAIFTQTDLAPLIEERRCPR